MSRRPQQRDLPRLAPFLLNNRPSPSSAPSPRPRAARGRGTAGLPLSSPSRRPRQRDGGAAALLAVAPQREGCRSSDLAAGANLARPGPAAPTLIAACLLLPRRHPLSPSPAQLEGDDLLSEILLRLPPQPSSLPRASAVCSRWRRLLSDPAFRRRFRVHHRRAAPLLGFFISHRGIAFQPALDAPDRLPLDRFQLKLDDDHYITLGCRHGLALFFLPTRLQVLVWDPIAGHQHRLAVPPDFELDGDESAVSGAVLCAAGDVDYFRVVLVGSAGKQPITALAWVYSSETGVWGDCISEPIPSEGLFIFRDQPATLAVAGDCLHWSVTVAGSRSILKFHLDTQSLDLSLLPGDYYTPLSPVAFTVVLAEGGGMGFLFLYQFTAELWSTKLNRDGVVIWELGRSIELDKLLGLHSEKETPQMEMIGYAEENNAVFFTTLDGDADYMVHLESLQFKKLPKTTLGSYYIHSKLSILRTLVVETNELNL